MSWLDNRTFWTPERVEILNARFLAGDSFAQIAKAVGDGCSRNAVLAKAWRLGLKRDSEIAVENNRLNNPKLNVERQRYQNNGLNFRKAAPAKLRAVITGGADTAPGLPPEPYEPAGLATIATIGLCMCRWPIGDPSEPTFTLCGKKTLGTYCEPHAERAYTVKPAPKAKDYERSLRRYVA